MQASIQQRLKGCKSSDEICHLLSTMKSIKSESIFPCLILIEYWRGCCARFLARTIHATFIFTTLLLPGLSSLSQSSGHQVKIHPDYISFGTVGPQTDRVADIIVENSGNASVQFLRHTFSDEFEVRQTSKTILPDSSIVIRIKFKPKRKGEYSEKVELWFSSMNTPLKIPVDARVEYVSPASDTSCPDFNSRRAECCPTNMFLAEVVDKQTGEVIKDALIEISEQGVVQKKLKTMTDGRVTQYIPIGYYKLIASKPGYTTHKVESYVNRNYSFFRFEIERKSEPKPDTPIVLAPLPLPPNPPEVVEPAVIEIPIIIPTEPVAPVAEQMVELEPVDSITIVIGGLPDDIEMVEPEILPVEFFSANNMVFVVDVSQSMATGEKMELMKNSLFQLTSALRSIDRMGLVSYSSSATLLLPSTTGDMKSEIKAMVEKLEAGGTTSGYSGFKSAYGEVKKHLIAGGNNQVIVITDGIFGVEDSEKIKKLVAKNAKKGIRTSIVGIKSAAFAGRNLAQYTEIGNGAFVLIENAADQNALIEEIKKRSAK